MKFTLENIGPVKKADVTLGDLTVIAGKNNTGKTYIAYSIYGFLNGLCDSYGLYTLVDEEAKPKMDLEESAVTMPEDVARGYYEKSLLLLARYFASRGIDKMFSSEKKMFQNAKVYLNSPLSGSGNMAENEARKILYKGGAEFTAPAPQRPFFTIRFARRLPSDMRDDIAIECVSFYYANQQVKESPFIMPAERFGISLFYKELDFAKNRLVEQLQSLSNKKKAAKGDSFMRRFGGVMDSSARYADPIKHYIDFVRDLGNVQKEKSDFADSKFFDGVKDMMGAYYRHSDSDIRLVSKKRKDGAYDIPLYLASSSARGLSGFYFYLRHVAKKGQLLIIDEPESHLSTDNQILLARLLARCVNAGLKVLMTTHSDYMIKELNNLIMLSSDLDNREKLMKKLGYAKEDCLKRESVKAYVCESGGAAPCAVNAYGMNMPVFDATIERINETSRALAVHMPEGE